MNNTQDQSEMTATDCSLHHLLSVEEPSLAIVIPVNAKGDLNNVLLLLQDISKYAGKNRFQVILVVNNYPPEAPPSDFLDLYRAAGAEVLALPVLVGHAGIPPGLKARMAALQTVQCRAAVFFDADCRIPHPTKCLDWYAHAFTDPSTKLAYTRIAYFNWPSGVGMWLWLRVHYLWRWTKRNLLRVPTPQGASYAMDQKLKCQLYEQGYLADETAIGRLAQSFKHKTVYNGSRSCQITTDARMYENAKPLRMFTIYAWRRIRINVASFIIRQDSAEHTGRENDQPHHYDADGRRIDANEV